MYDKVKFFVDRSIIGSQYTNITNHLEKAKVETDQTTGETRTKGTMNGLSIDIFCMILLGLLSHLEKY